MSFPLLKKQIKKRNNVGLSVNSIREKILDILEIMAEYSSCSYSPEISELNGIVFSVNY
ncbi:hypothetical protein [Treponema sp.]|uniref:hypothetical protein n=1 Tax=Treponema sp. TaxID=166 RepID=UPI00388D7848